ncbi:MAG: UDP-N-acetylmuramate--L-alanine ligase [Actinomycetota bacterium]
MSGIDFQSPVGDLAALSPAHFIGVGGAGMSGVATLWMAAGSVVSGSDARDSPALTELRAQGATVFVGHHQDHLSSARCVVVSSAVRDDNPEVRRARERGIPILHRSQALAAVGSNRHVIAVAGTNGKTTTTAMITSALLHLGHDPSYSIGGTIRSTGRNASLGRDETMVIEADESDGSFVVYHPHIAVVTNVQPDHLDFYGDEEGVRQGFLRFAQSLRPGGVLIACADDAGSLWLAEQVRSFSGSSAKEQIRVFTYGQSLASDYRLIDPGSTVDGTVFKLEDTMNHTVIGRLMVPGVYNAMNAVAAVAALAALGVPTEQAITSLAGFSGTSRRFEYRGTHCGVRVFDDYAHNPGKVAAAVHTGRQVVGQGRLIVIFQPHLFSRTRDLAVGLATGLAAADEVFILDVYAAREEPIPGVSGLLIAEQIPSSTTEVHFMPDRRAVMAHVVTQARPGDVVLTIGAGDVTELAGAILGALEEASFDSDVDAPHGLGHLR